VQVVRLQDSLMPSLRGAWWTYEGQERCSVAALASASYYFLVGTPLVTKPWAYLAAVMLHLEGKANQGCAISAFQGLVY
jgi:hypothetical protein